ncbi:MAG: hypothetical protein M3Z66_07715 [Chloroflexota bacterium]|nr:hypothetical protein [Chloroflexota bacterium]
MPELNCRTAQVWLQDTSDLVTPEAQLLDAHLEHCAVCNRYQAWRSNMDQSILHTLSADTVGLSVRNQVLRQLSDPVRPAARLLARRGIRRLSVAGSRLTPRSLWAAFPIAVLAALLFLFLPQAMPGNRHVIPSVTESDAAWHVVRPTTGFPLALDPVRPNHLLAGAWGSVYQSWTGGDSWHLLARLHAGVIRSFAIDRSRPNRYLVAMKHSVLISDDAGRHWRRAVNSLPGAENMFLVQHPTRPSTFYLGPSVLWKSENRGQSWEPAGTSPIFAPDGIQALTVAPSGALYSGIWNGGVAVSHDGGRTWQRRASGLDRHVLDVEISPHGVLWAATVRGLYSSSDDGRRWAYSRGPGHFYATGVAFGPGYILASGVDALFRSSDGGGHWALAMDGLPLAPYINSVFTDPFHPQRVYASLNSDGVFRSDDGGRHWGAVDNGLQIKGSDAPHPPVLFLRDGSLWHTDRNGIDPGVLTADQDVRLAAISPDGVASAYLAVNSTGWAVRLVSVGGSGARTVASGTDSPPRELLWSPNAALLAMVQPGMVTVSNLGHSSYHRTLTTQEQVLGWAANGRDLLIWNSGSKQIVSADAKRFTGITVASLPFLAPDGRHLASLVGGRLRISTIGGATSRVRVRDTCQIAQWSDDSARLLLTCGSRGAVQERDQIGHLVARTRLPGIASWMPGSHTDLMFFHRGALWRWARGETPSRIVVHAQSAHG